MCGIVGELSFGDHGVCDRETQERLVSLMRRRGPDDEGIWGDEQRCFLGFRRLAVLDLSSASRQPMISCEGRHVLVFNGELYNFRDLRRELEQSGAGFRTSGDSEVVLQSLVAWGQRALSRFNGMFALALYDRQDKTLLLARDCFGIKPLYYMRTEAGVVFASQYDQILRHPAAGRLSVSTESLATYLRLGYIPAPRGILQGTHMLEPGCWLKFSSNGHELAGKHFVFPHCAEPSLAGDEAVVAVDAAVSNAVRRQLVSDVPVGAFLSGGIDSPLVTAKMQADEQNGYRAFTIGTGGDALDESADAVAYADQIGIQHIVETCTADDALSLVNDVVAACGEPFADYSMFPTLMVSRLARRDVKVVLSGDGGDEMFWGYYGRFASVLEVCDQFRQSQWRRFIRQRAGRLLGVSEYHFGLRQATIGHWYHAKHQRLPSEWIRRLIPDMPNVDTHDSLFAYSGWKQDTTAQWLRWNEVMGHLTMVLLKVDRASMYNSLEVRVPLLDQEVVNVAMQVDWRTCLDPIQGLGKLPLRRSLAQHVQHQTHSKRGFSVPMGNWMKGPLRPLFQAHVVHRDDLLGYPLNRRAAEEFMKQHTEGSSDMGWALWVLLSLALWEDHHFRPSRGLDQAYGTCA